MLGIQSIVSIVFCVQATASQKVEAGKHLASIVESLEQQVPQAMASKASVERKRNATVLKGKQAKVWRIYIIQPVHLS